MGSELIKKVKYDTMPIVADELKVLLVLPTSYVIQVWLVYSSAYDLTRPVGSD